VNFHIKQTEIDTILVLAVESSESIRQNMAVMEHELVVSEPVNPWMVPCTSKDAESQCNRNEEC
jgi:hypothetical protein